MRTQSKSLRFRGWFLCALVCTGMGVASAQDGVGFLRQSAFDASGNRWAVLDSMQRSWSRTPGLVPLLLCGSDSLGASGVLTSRQSLRKGEAVTWRMATDGLGGCGDDAVPELWIDGVFIGSGWYTDLAWTAPVSADCTVVHVVLPRPEGAMDWSMLFETKSLCSPPPPDLPPWPFADPSNPWWVETVHNGIPVSGMALTRLGADGAFNRPLLVVEGFDPDLNGTAPVYGFGTMNWDAIWDCSDLAYPNTASMAYLLDSLQSEGFDLVYVDFQDGTLPALAQAALLETVLDRIATAVEAPGGTVVVGASMGGVIARLALRRRELAGIEDCVRQFITVDSPHQGAYLPLALQEALAFFAQEDPQAASLMNALNSPAARELLLLTPDGVLPEHLELQALLSTYGWPQTPACTALSNGHPLVNVPQGADALIQGSIAAWGVNWAQVQLWPLPGNPYHSASTANANVVFDCSLPNTNGTWWEDLVTEGTAWCATGAPAWENVPASTSPHIQALSNALEAAGFVLESATDWTAFVPVFSALDEMEGAAPSVQRRHEPVGSAPASHCDLTGHVDYLLTAILQAAAIGDPGAGDASAYPHWGHLQPHRTFMGGGSLQDGMAWTIGTPLGNGGWGTAWPTFHVQLAPCATPLLIGEGGSLEVGEPTGQGRGALHVTPGNVLAVGSGGTLQIGLGSELVVDAGGTLVLAGNGLQLAPGATLRVEPGGRVEITESGTIAPGEWARIELLGDICCNDHVAFAISGNGTNEVVWSGTCFLGEGAEWRLSGEESALPLRSAGPCRCEGAGCSRWTDVAWALDSIAHVDLAATQRWKRLTMESDGTSFISSSARWRWEGGGGDRLDIHHARVGNSDPLWADLVLTSSQVVTEFSAPRASDCTFEHTPWQSHLAPGGNWTRCAFSGNPEATGLALVQSTGPHVLDGCSFDDLGTGLLVDQSTSHLACSEWTHCATGIALMAGGEAVLLAPAGGHNRFEMNERHATWDEAPWWDCAGGSNHFGPCWETAFSGSLVGVLGSNNTSAWLPASGNSWQGIAPNQLADLTSQGTGTAQLSLQPALLGPTSCGVGSPPLPVSAGPKSVNLGRGQPLIWEPAAPESGTLKLVNALGQTVERKVIEGRDKRVVWPLNAHPCGWYHLVWLPDGSAAAPSASILLIQ